MAVKPSAGELPVTVRLPDHVPVHVGATVEPEVRLPERVPVKLGSLELRASAVHVGAD